jgi:hypothetical protein
VVQSPREGTGAIYEMKRKFQKDIQSSYSSEDEKSMKEKQEQAKKERIEPKNSKNIK